MLGCMSRQSVLADALALPPEERARLVGQLIESLDEPGQELDPASWPESWEDAWIPELNRRIAELESGRTRTIAAETVFAKLRERFDSEAG